MPTPGHGKRPRDLQRTGRQHPQLCGLNFRYIGQDRHYEIKPHWEPEVCTPQNAKGKGKQKSKDRRKEGWQQSAEEKPAQSEQTGTKIADWFKNPQDKAE